MNRIDRRTYLVLRSISLGEVTWRYNYVVGAKLKDVSGRFWRRVGWEDGEDGGPVVLTESGERMLAELLAELMGEQDERLRETLDRLAEM